MQCPQCQGTNLECGCGTGKCDHCKDGVVVDFPLNQERYVPRYLDPESVSALARYWSDRTCVDTLGEFIARCAAQGVAEYKRELERVCSDPTSIGDFVNNDYLPCEKDTWERNKIWKERQASKEAK